MPTANVHDGVKYKYDTGQLTYSINHLFLVATVAEAPALPCRINIAPHANALLVLKGQLCIQYYRLLWTAGECVAKGRGSHSCGKLSATALYPLAASRGVQKGYRLVPSPHKPETDASFFLSRDDDKHQARDTS